LAAKVAAAIDAPHRFKPLYPLELSVEDKIRTIVQEVYGADGVDFSVPALKRLAEIEKNGWSGLPVCMAKTQYSFSDDATRLGAPKGFTVHVRDLIPKTGAGFIVALTGAVMTMPGLPKVPAAMRMDVDADGNPLGLF
jgi:formate--tetrahydrofolate ligase